MGSVRALVELVTSHLLVFLTFALGLSLGPGELRASARRPAFLRGLLVAFLAVPLVTLVVVLVLPVPRGPRAFLLLISACPGVALMVNTIRKRGGDLPLGALLSLTMTVLAVLLMPLTIALIDRGLGVALRAPVGVLLWRIALPVLAATGLGLVVRRLRPALAARLFVVSMALFKLALGIVLVVLGAKGLRELVRIPMVLFATAIITLASAAVGHLAGGPTEAERRTLAIAAAYGNPVLALTIVQLSYPDVSAVPAVAAYLLVRTATLICYLAWGSRKTGGLVRNDRGPRRAGCSAPPP